VAFVNNEGSEPTDVAAGHAKLYSSASQIFKTGMAFSLTQGALDAKNKGLK
jgi:hypothetical protein